MDITTDYYQRLGLSFSTRSLTEHNYYIEDICFFDVNTNIFHRVS